MQRIESATYVAPLGALLLFATGADAQTLYGIDGNISGGGTPPNLVEFTGPPNPGFCNYPNGPIVNSFPAVGGPVCPGLIPFALPLDGDVAHDELNDFTFASDGGLISYYNQAGTQIDSFPAPIFVTGMGFDALAQLIWITDGVIYGAIPVPPIPACLTGPPPFLAGPWPLPVGPPFFLAPVTDIEWDPGTGTLWGCDLAGMVGNFFPGPAPAPGPFGFFPAAPGVCGLTPALTGLAIDDAIPGSGTIWVTDGVQVAYMLPGGVPAPPTFYSPFPCYPVPGAPISGLAFTSHAITFGVSTTVGGTPPLAGSQGDAFLGNPLFAFTVTGAPGDGATLYFGSGGAACPQIPVFGLLLQILPTWVPIGTVVIPPGGTASLPTGIPATPIFSPGRMLDFQWVSVSPFGAIGASEGTHLTIALP